MRFLAALGILALAEIAVFFRVEDRVGFLPILGVVAVTAVIGLLVIQRSGVAVVGTVRAKMREGRLPGEDLSRGLARFLAGICLLLPGLITDVLGLVLLAPPLQSWVHRSLASRVSSRVTVVTSRVRQRRGPIIDVEPVDHPRLSGSDPEPGPDD